MKLQFEQQGGSDREIKGYTYMTPSSGAEKYQSSSKIKQATLPEKVDLRQFMTAVEDQKQLSSCTANAVAGAYEYLVKKYLSNIISINSSIFFIFAKKEKWGI